MARKTLVRCVVCGLKDTYSIEMLNVSKNKNSIWVHIHCKEEYDLHGEQLRTCSYCKKKDTAMRNMIEYKLGVKKRSYVHRECNDKYIAENEKQIKENKEWDDLYHYLCSLHDCVVLETKLIIELQKLRNGELPRQKKGVPYHMIMEAYKYASKDIQYAKSMKKFKDANAEMMYCYKIMRDKINTVYRRTKNKAKIEAKQKAAMNELISQLEFEDNIRKPTMEQKKAAHRRGEVDISDLL
ncbi:hypothetical protein QB910_000085 [Dabrowskivirus KKP3916]|uniref:Uncharacterized protein n=1 Tax=Alicyclobacillus phage KKP_3916 TaxID=3040651 RepID=A0AAT9V7M3_9CAUD|nr:hypothetical protein QB910_000085 [Alicyclobacillus phage KKP 3916]